MRGCEIILKEIILLKRSGKPNEEAIADLPNSIADLSREISLTHPPRPPPPPSYLNPKP